MMTRDSGETVEIKRSSGNLAEMKSVDYMFIKHVHMPKYVV